MIVSSKRTSKRNGEKKCEEIDDGLEKNSFEIPYKKILELLNISFYIF